LNTLSIIIPAYNEGKTIHLILEKVIAVKLENIRKEIIIVNDCSTDDTTTAVERFTCRSSRGKHPVLSAGA
jgi:glycosyltransferase involved in cell wall biosynthesis